MVRWPGAMVRRSSAMVRQSGDAGAFNVLPSPFCTSENEGDMPFRLSANAIAAAVLCATGIAAAQADLAKLKDPAQLAERAPDSFRARFDTSQGPFVIAVDRQWAPLAADRFYNLVKNDFYNDARFFRVLDGFMVQFGLHADPGVQSA